MSEEKTTREYKVGTLPHLPVTVHAQYLKDLSFENPHAPHSLRAGSAEKPALNVNILLDAQKIEDPELTALYEVVMTVKAESSRGGRIDFIAEISFGAAVSLKDVPEDKHHPLLFIEVPRLMFPFVRQAMAQITQGGGYAPLYLQPVDFHAMYVSRFAEKPEAASGNA